MCRYNVAIDDAIMDTIRPTIENGMDEDAWVQLQVNILFSRLAEERLNLSFDENYMESLISKSAPAWKGISNADQWVHELRGE